jgi:preprotein translocase subunit SecG
MSALFTFVLVVHVILAVALVILVLLQRSEGGVLGIGGSSSGLMTARGAADLLTTATRWLATAFVITSIALAAIAARDRKGNSNFADELDKKGAPVTSAPASTGPGSTGPSSSAPEVPLPSLNMPGLPTATEAEATETAPAETAPAIPAPAPQPATPAKPAP